MDLDLASRQEARDLIARTRTAFEKFRHFPQEAVDEIVFAMVEAGYRESVRLAEMAVKETGFGRVDGKTAKNRFATRGLWNAIADLRTAGLIASDPARGLYDYADPFGVVAAIIPTTNPTSTALFKAIICVKSRNGMVTSPHPRAVGCIAESIRVVHDAAVAAGAPKDLVTSMTRVSLEGTEELMQHKGIDLILATGGSGLVKAAYSSGKPAFGVGPGNAPAYVDRSADPAHAARCIIDSQTFDNSTICASEQSLVIDRPIRDAFLAEMKKLGAHLCSAEEARALAKVTMKGRGMNPDIVGLFPHQIAKLAGFTVPESTTVLLADSAGVGPEYPLSIEKLSPILSMFDVDGWHEGCERSIEVLRYGGLGHTLVIHCRDEKIIREFAEKKPVNRLLVNTPSAQGAVGYTTNLFPSMTLGCGSFGGNITSDNVGPLHLLNIKRLAYVKPEYATPAWQADFSGPLPPRHRRQGAAPAAEGAGSVWDDREHRSGGGAGHAEHAEHAEHAGHAGPALASAAPAAPCVHEVSPIRSTSLSANEIEDIIRAALASKRDGDCPFGKCAECPPAGQACEHGFTSNRA